MARQGSQAIAETRSGRDELVSRLLIDCDIHHRIVPTELMKRLPKRWGARFEGFGLTPNSTALGGYTRPRRDAAMSNSWPSDGYPGSDREFLTSQLLDRWGHTYAILNPIDQTAFQPQRGEYAAALVRAINDWTREEWLDKDKRFYASIAVPFEDSDLAVDEVAKCAPNPRFIQVLANVITESPVGNRKYWPIYEAAAHYGLPLALHVGGGSGHPKSSAGWPSTCFEDHAGYAYAFVAQVTSLIAEGVFQRFPALKVVLQEGGFAWMPALMWRMDRAYELLVESIGPLEKLPSQYCREHLWFTTQPIEEPEHPRDFMTVVRDLDMDDRLLFATDYPHWDFDAPDRAIPSVVPAELRAKIFADNALALYDRLPRPVPAV